MSGHGPRSSITCPHTARRVLDLGCATGTTGAALKQRQPAHVTGIEIEPEYAREAATRLDHVIEGDVSQRRRRGHRTTR